MSDDGDGGQGDVRRQRKRHVKIRTATVSDARIIAQLLQELAAHDGHSDECKITEKDIVRFGFCEDPYFEVLIVEEDESPVGLALFFMTFTIWHASPCLFLSDLYVKEQCRGLGIGKEIFSKLAEIAVERGCSRMEWQVLDQAQAIKFYEQMGSEKVDEFHTYRLSGSRLKHLAGTND